MHPDSEKIKTFETMIELMVDSHKAVAYKIANKSLHLAVAYMELCIEHKEMTAEAIEQTRRVTRLYADIATNERLRDYIRVAASIV